MSWKEKMKEFGGGNFTFLSEDGEAITFIVVGDPVLLKSTYKGKEQERVGCPIVTDDGFCLLIGGKRLARKITKLEMLFNTHALMAVRHGAVGDTDTKYDVKALPEAETYRRLVAIRDADFKPDMIAEAVAEASDTLGS